MPIDNELINETLTTMVTFPALFIHIFPPSSFTNSRFVKRKLEIIIDRREERNGERNREREREREGVYVDLNRFWSPLNIVPRAPMETVGRSNRPENSITSAINGQRRSREMRGRKLGVGWAPRQIDPFRSMGSAGRSPHRAGMLDIDGQQIDGVGDGVDSFLFSSLSFLYSNVSISPHFFPSNRYDYDDYYCYYCYYYRHFDFGRDKRGNWCTRTKEERRSHFVAFLRFLFIIFLSLSLPHVFFFFVFLPFFLFLPPLLLFYTVLWKLAPFQAISSSYRRCRTDQKSMNYILSIDINYFLRPPPLDPSSPRCIWCPHVNCSFFHFSPFSFLPPSILFFFIKTFMNWLIDTRLRIVRPFDAHLASDDNANRIRWNGKEIGKGEKRIKHAERNIKEGEDCGHLFCLFLFLSLSPFSFDCNYHQRWYYSILSPYLVRMHVAISQIRTYSINDQESILDRDGLVTSRMDISSPWSGCCDCDFIGHSFQTAGIYWIWLIGLDRPAGYWTPSVMIASLQSSIYRPARFVVNLSPPTPPPSLLLLFLLFPDQFEVVSKVRLYIYFNLRKRKCFIEGGKESEGTEGRFYFHFILFHFISFYFILFHFISFYFISFCFVLFSFVLEPIKEGASHQVRLKRTLLRL